MRSRKSRRATQWYMAPTGIYVFVLLALGPASAQEDSAHESPPGEAVSNYQIQRWVADLDADQFVVRESATKNLIAAGEPAVETVALAMADDRKELTTRGIYVLQELAKCGDADTERAARAELETMAAEKVTWVARRAGASLEALNVIRQRRAIKALEWLGAKIQHYAGHFGPQAAQRPISIHIDDQWKGSDEDLIHVQWLVDAQRVVFRGSQVNNAWLDRIKPMPNLTTVSIVHAEITDEGLAHLQDISSLRRLNVWYTPITDGAIGHLKRLKHAQQLVLYGTQISREGADRLRSEMVGVNVMIANGAFLGVGATPRPQGCVISTVHRGSSAERAGLSVGDMITHYNGKEVRDFEMLRVLIGENRSGDDVEVKIRRNSEELTKKIRLGEWDYRTFLY